MADICLYFDADAMQRGMVHGLRARAVDAMTAHEAKMAGATDEEQLEFARREGRVLFSFNASDFFRISSGALWMAGTGS